MSNLNNSGNTNSGDKQHDSTTLAFGWINESENVYSMEIDEKAFDAIHKAKEQGLEIGGKLCAKRLSEKSRQKFKNYEKGTAPTHVFELISREGVQRMKSYRGGNKKETL